MHIAVIGAGVIGCATAFELARRGHAVTLVESSPGVARGASFANGAQLSYAYVEPLANPATLRALPALLVDPQSPLRFRPRWDLGQWRWGLAFLRACSAAQAERGSRRLAQLAALSRSVLEHWIDRHALEFGLQRNGKLVLCPDFGTLERQRRQLDLLAECGAQQSLLDREACIAREPALAGYGGFVGGVWTQGECAVDPLRYCHALVEGTVSLGGRLLLDTRVEEILHDGHRATSISTSSGRIEADAFVVAAGLASRSLMARLGERLPVYPIKGYSLTLRIQDPARAPRTNVTDLARKTVFAPLGDHLRVAAMAELSGEDLSLDPGRLAAMATGVRQTFPHACDFGDPQPWAGLRPATPDSLPIIRRSRLANLFINAGHGALGLTLAAASAHRVAALVEEAHAAGG